MYNYNNYLDLRQFDLSKLNKVEQEFLENLKLDWKEDLGLYKFSDRINQEDFLGLVRQFDNVREKSILLKYMDERLLVEQGKLTQMEVRRFFYEKEKVIL